MEENYYFLYTFFFHSINRSQDGYSNPNTLPNDQNI